MHGRRAHRCRCRCRPAARQWRSRAGPADGLVAVFTRRSLPERASRSSMPASAAACTRSRGVSHSKASSSVRASRSFCAAVSRSGSGCPRRRGGAASSALWRRWMARSSASSASSRRPSSGNSAAAGNECVAPLRDGGRCGLLGRAQDADAGQRPAAALAAAQVRQRRGSSRPASTGASQTSSRGASKANNAPSSTPASVWPQCMRQASRQLPWRSPRRWLDQPASRPSRISMDVAALHQHQHRRVQRRQQQFHRGAGEELVRAQALVDAQRGQPTQESDRLRQQQHAQAEPEQLQHARRIEAWPVGKELEIQPEILRPVQASPAPTGRNPAPAA